MKFNVGGNHFKQRKKLYIYMWSQIHVEIAYSLNEDVKHQECPSMHVRDMGKGDIKHNIRKWLKLSNANYINYFDQRYTHLWSMDMYFKKKIIKK